MRLMSQNLSELLEALPLCASAPPIDSANVPDGVKYVTEARPTFVEPDITFGEEQLAGCQVVVVAASAAVGKSWLAEHIALKTGGILWNLAQAQVGDSFAIGTLAMAHGTDHLTPVVQSLQSGKFLIVADALDEARLRVTFDSFCAFLDGLARQILKAVPLGQPSVVLLARTETAGFAADWLRDLHISVAEVGIDFFDRPHAVEFIEKQLVSRRMDPANPVVREAIELVLHRTLLLLGADADGDWPTGDLRSFVGYAPVLVAIGRYLASSRNPKKLIEEFASWHQAGPMWGLLQDLADDILEREQDKFVDAFKEAVASTAAGIEFTDWSALFTPRQQCDLLVRARLGYEPDYSMVVPELRDQYGARVQSWLPEHPFVGASPQEFSSPVFEDYVYASVLVAGDERARSAVRTRAANATYRPTELLARFAIGMTGDAPLVAEDLPVVYESILAGAKPGRDPLLSLIEETDGSMRATISVRGEQLRFELLAAGEPLQFITRLGPSGIVTRTSTIQLGVGGRLFEMGPETFVVAPRVEVLAGALFVESSGGSDDDDVPQVLIFTGALAHSDPTVRFVHGKERFLVSSESELHHPFADRTMGELRFPAAVSPVVREIARAFLRLAGHFKTQGYDGGLGTFADPIDRMASRNPQLSAILKVADDQGVIVKEGAFYRLDPSALSLSYLAVRQQKLTPELIEFARTVERELEKK